MPKHITLTLNVFFSCSILLLVNTFSKFGYSYSNRQQKITNFGHLNEWEKRANGVFTFINAESP